MSFQWNQDSLIMIKVQILQHAHVGIFPSQNLLTLFCLFIGHKKILEKTDSTFQFSFLWIFVSYRYYSKAMTLKLDFQV